MAIYYVSGIPYPDELYHWGIKGQKWGIRRYQNEDGSLTKEGKQRYRVNSVNEYRQRQFNAGKSISESTGNIVGKTSDIVRRQKNKESYKVDNKIKKMSDDELRKKINRIQMERQYAMLTSSERSSGKEKALEVLETTGSVVAIIGGTLGIAATIRSLMGGK